MFSATSILLQPECFSLTYDPHEEDSEMKDDGEVNALDVVNDEFEIDEIVMEEALLHEEELGLEQASSTQAEETCVGVM